MRRSRRRATATVLALAAAAAGSLLFVSPAVAAPPAASLTVAVTPTVTEGQPITVTVAAADVTDLYAYDVTLEFDPALVSVDAGTAGGPDGGFTSATTGTGTVTLSHTRLGTSPGLAGAGPITLGTLTFTALDGGTAEIVLAAARLVSSTTEVTALAAVASATTVITALPDAGPEPEPGSGGSGSPVASPSPSAGVASGSAASDDAGDLANTGADAAPWMIGGAVGVALVAAGAVVVLRRRQAVRS
jgi:LPXTG-motif cell wall-anchored protein